MSGLTKPAKEIRDGDLPAPLDLSDTFPNDPIRITGDTAKPLEVVEPRDTEIPPATLHIF